MNPEMNISMLPPVTMLLMLIGLIFAVLSDHYIKRAHRIIMLIIASLVIFLVIQNVFEFLLENYYKHPIARTMNSIVGYSIRPLILLLFFYIVDESQDYEFPWVLVSVNAVIHLTALFSHMTFWITPENRYVRGPMGYSCHLISAILLARLLWISLKNYDRIHKSDVFLPVFNSILIVGSVIIDSFREPSNTPVTWLTSSIVCSCIFYYIWLHLQFVRQYEMNLQAEQRIQLMISQIQPHFLYNTLAAIQDMCLTEPRLAAETIGKFGLYLRQNLESLEMPGLISFEREIEHTRTYTDIEQKRFGNLQVDYSIEDGGFCLPALTVQPLVENAIRHGVRKRDPGVVSIAARRETDAHLITVRDNGVGFDVSAANEAGNDHIGIRNVRDRLEKLCGGTLRLDSRIGEGTVAEIRIPVRENEEETPCE